MKATTDSLDWATVTLSLPDNASDNPKLRIKFVLDEDADYNEYAFLDNVTVTGEPLIPALAVTKEVLDNESWVKSVNASINDTLTFKSTITNTGNINLTQIRFWDILDCSLEFKDAPDYPCADSYTFKPKVLHPDSSWSLSDPWGESFTELCPVTGTSWEIVDWEDTTNHRGNVSACDQLQLASSIFEDDFQSSSWTMNWSTISGAHRDGPDSGNYYIDFSDTGNVIISNKIDATSMCDLTVSYRRKNSDWDSGHDYFYAWYSTDNGTNWALIESVDWSINNWAWKTFALPPAANNNPNLRLKFNVTDGSDTGEHAYLDDVSVSRTHWYHVDRVPYTLNLSNATYGTKYFDSVLNWNDPGMDLSNPINTTWLCVCCCKEQYTLIGWNGCPAGIGAGDSVTMQNERTGEEVQYTVEEVAKDLVVSREWEIADPLKPEDTITIEYNATVVRCGVDNNTFVAKGLGCDDTWTYSDPAVVTVTVPCAAPSGEATDPTGLAKEVYATTEEVYGTGSGFAANKSVDIYILPFMTLVGGEDLNALKVAGPVNVQTDANGDIGAVNPVLVWPNPVPGHYLMVFDDPDGDLDPGADPLDDFTVIGTALVPLVTPPGIVALIGLLSIVAIGTIARKNKKR